MCNLGLGQSIYQSQPGPGKAFATLGLRFLRWHGWGHYGATARALSCDVAANGAADMTTCDHATVQVYKPESVGPAGFIYIYQLIVVRHGWSLSEPYRYTYWYQPGVDY